VGCLKGNETGLTEPSAESIVSLKKDELKIEASCW